MKTELQPEIGSRRRLADFPRAVLVMFTCAMPIRPVVADVLTGNPGQPGTSRVIVTVNGQAITEDDLSAIMLIRRITAKQRAAVRKQLIEQLVDRKLVAALLAAQGFQADPELLDSQAKRILKMIRKRGDDPAAVLKKLGLTEQSLRNELALPLTWLVYAKKVITGMQMRECFARHREEFDGTQVRASQIVIRLARNGDAAAVKAAGERLERLRADIVAGRLSFAEAARKHSQSPSGKKGGDLGFFAHRGRMPAVIAREVFKLKKGEVGRPFVSPFGVHIAIVTARKPGRLSLEDARPAVFRRLSDDLWRSTVARLRSKAKIVRNPR